MTLCKQIQKLLLDLAERISLVVKRFSDVTCLVYLIGKGEIYKVEHIFPDPNRAPLLRHGNVDQTIAFKTGLVLRWNVTTGHADAV